jgi:anthranilate phosphoribosyltransferase
LIGLNLSTIGSTLAQAQDQPDDFGDSDFIDGNAEPMSHVFRALLQKIGSGPHTGVNLTRAESADATRMMLLQEATPAQIGAFMIAHRIKRPTGIEMAGMLDAYNELGQRLQLVQAAYPVTVLNSPYDGRTRTAPLSPVTALILATAEVPTILHGGDRMPTKAGVPLIELWQALGVDWQDLSITQVQQVLESAHLGFVYLPQHFPLAAEFVTFREQIGKRPPFATLELMWSPYAGPAHRVCGFVHPPTEGFFREAFALHGIDNFTTVKGLEGSVDLPRDRTDIIGWVQPGQWPTTGSRPAIESPSEAASELLGDPLERLTLVPRDFGFAGKDWPLEPTPNWAVQIQATLDGQLDGPAGQAVLWNSGFYLWRCGVTPDLGAGLELAKELLRSGQVRTHCNRVIEAIRVAT